MIIRSAAYFYPRPPWGGRPTAWLIGTGLHISIHALRGEGDSFNRCEHETHEISIHALRGEGDDHRQQHRQRHQHFYPRPPWGGRRMHGVNSPGSMLFLSTPSVGRATLPSANSISTRSVFLSTPSVGRATQQGHALVLVCLHFYPRPPWGGRPTSSVWIS